MSENSLKSKTVSGIGWSFIDNIANQGITFLVGLVLARLLSPHEYGLIGIITIFIAVFNTLVDSGLSNALIRKVNPSEEDFNTAFFANLGASIFFFLVLFLSAPLIASFFEEPILTVLLRVMSCIIIINAFIIIQKVKLTKQIDFKTQAKCSLVSSTVSGVIGISMALNGLGVWSLVGQQISRQFLFASSLWFWGRWIPTLKVSVRSFKELFGFGWKILASSLLDTTWKEIYQVVIGKCYTAATLGLFTRARQFSMIFSNNLSSIIQKVSFPTLSNIQDDHVLLKNSYRKLIRISSFVTFVLMTWLASVAKPLIIILIGEQWVACIPFLQILCLQMFFYPIDAINLNLLQVFGKSNIYLYLEIIKKITFVVPLLLGVFVDIYWMLWASVVTSVIELVLNGLWAGAPIDYSFKDELKDMFPSLGICVVIAICMYVPTLYITNYYMLITVQSLLCFATIWLISYVIKLEEVKYIKGIVITLKNKIL